MAGIVHKAVKASGEKGLASEWNDDHEITADVNVATHKLINVVDPAAAQDAATRKYVLDSLNNGLLDWDTCWLDAVHSHVDNAEGGLLPQFNVATGHDHDGADSKKLDWDSCWTDAVHSHANAGEGGQLAWDNVWSDAVHDHSNNAEGGLLDWDTCWTDAVHSHTDNAEGGVLPQFDNVAGHDHDGVDSKLLDWDTCWTDAVHDHSDAANGGGLDWDTCWTDAVHDHSNAANGGQFTNLTILGDYNMAIETRYYAVNPASWVAASVPPDEIIINYRQVFVVNNDVVLSSPVNLPHGAIVTNVIVYGNIAAAAETWSLKRVNKDSGTFVTMATNNFNSADATIDNATIDNANYTYGLESSSMDANDTVYGGIITYTITKPYP